MVKLESSNENENGTESIAYITLVGKSVVSCGDSERISLHYLEEDEKPSTNCQVTPEPVIDSLVSYKVRSRNASSMIHFCCDICQHRYRVGDYVTALPCQHKFHNYCIENWLRWVRSSCPVDKKPVTKKGCIVVDEDQDNTAQEGEDETRNLFELMNTLNLDQAEKLLQSIHLDETKKIPQSLQMEEDKEKIARSPYKNSLSNRFAKGFDVNKAKLNANTDSPKEETKKFAEKTIFVKNSESVTSQKTSRNSPRTYSINEAAGYSSSETCKLVAKKSKMQSLTPSTTKSFPVKRCRIKRSVLTTPGDQNCNSLYTKCGSASAKKRQELIKTIDDLREKLTDDSILGLQSGREDYFKGSYRENKNQVASQDFRKSENDKAAPGGDIDVTFNKNQRMTLQDIVASKTRTFASMLPPARAPKTDYVCKYNLKIPRNKLSTFY